MRSALERGIEGDQDFVVEGRLLTNISGNLPTSVLSTPAMIGMMENAAWRLVAPDLADGEVTVGFEVCVKHVAAAPEGCQCTARARLEEVVDERKLRFSVEVVAEDERTIGVGTHERRVVRPPRD
jgi:fluoroacetyl-CoA thioesterase